MEQSGEHRQLAAAIIVLGYLELRWVLGERGEIVDDAFHFGCQGFGFDQFLPIHIASFICCCFCFGVGNRGRAHKCRAGIFKKNAFDFVRPCGRLREIFTNRERAVYQDYGTGKKK